MAKEIADLVSFDKEEESCGEDAAATTQVTNGTLLGESSIPDVGAKGQDADEKDE